MGVWVRVFSYLFIVWPVGLLTVDFTRMWLERRGKLTPRDALVTTATTDCLFVPFGLLVGSALIYLGVTWFGVAIIAGVLVLSPLVAVRIRQLRAS